MNDQVIFGHPTGNANSRAAAVGLAEANLLSEFHTSIAVFPKSGWDKLSRFPGLSQLQRRTFHPDLQEVARTSPWKELGRMLASKAGLQKVVAHETGALSIDAIYGHLDKKMARSLSTSTAQGVYAYEDGAYHCFAAAKNRGVQRFYDLPIGYWKAARHFLTEEPDRLPDWAATLDGLKDSPAKLARKDRELALADRIYVASTFTKNSLDFYEGNLAPIDVIPYGFPPVSQQPVRSHNGQRPLQVLFVGGLSQRKGIAELFSAVDNLGKKVDLTVIGRKLGQPCPALDQALAKHRYIPSANHTEVLGEMRKADVLVFPSLFEGFGLVITEAMSQGTPVITTDRTAGPDLLTDGHDGWLSQPGKAESLQEKLEDLLIKPDSVKAAGEAARATAAQRPWAAYSQELAQSVQRELQTD